MADLIPFDRLALTLVHSAWQGFAVALVAWALMTLARRAAVRYAIGCAALLAMLAAPLATFVALGDVPTPSARGEAVTAGVAPDPPTAASSAAASPAAVAHRTTIAPPLPTRLAPPPPTETDRWRAALAGASPLIAAAWAVGVVLVATRHAAGLALVARLRRRATAIADADLRARLARLAARMGVRRPVALLASTAVDAPAVVGWLRPAILWPATLMTGLTPPQLDALLAHELAHVRRHDYLVNALQSVVETLGFYHPAVWWLSRRVRQEREHCCDDAAALVVGDRVAYAGALVAMEVARGLAATSPRGGASLALSARGGSLMTRVQRLLLPASDASRPAWFGAGAVFATLVLVVAALAWTAGDRARRDAAPLAAASAAASVASPAPTTSRPATFPTTTAADYAIAPGDLLRITIEDLVGVGVQSVLIKRVANSGNINLPYFKMPFAIAGQTEAQARTTIAAGYLKAQFLERAIVDVLVLQGSDGQRVPLELFATANSAPTQQQQEQLEEITRNLAQFTTQVQAATTRPAATSAANPVDPQQLAEITRSLAVLAAQAGAATTRPSEANAASAPDPKTTGAVHVAWAEARGQIPLNGQRLTVLQAALSYGLENRRSCYVRIIRPGNGSEKPQILNVRVDLSSGEGSEVDLQPGDTLIYEPPPEPSGSRRR